VITAAVTGSSEERECRLLLSQQSFPDLFTDPLWTFYEASFSPFAEQPGQLPAQSLERRNHCTAVITTNSAGS